MFLQIVLAKIYTILAFWVILYRLRNDVIVMYFISILIHVPIKLLLFAY